PQTAPCEKKLAVFVECLNAEIVTISNVQDFLRPVKCQIHGRSKLTFFFTPFTPASYKGHLVVQQQDPAAARINYIDMSGRIPLQRARLRDGSKCARPASGHKHSEINRLHERTHTRNKRLRV